jgi:hypothetical protein
MDGTMSNRNSQLLRAWFMGWDLLLTAVAWLGAYYLRFETGWLPVHKEPPDFDLCLRNLPPSATTLPDNTTSIDCVVSAKRWSASPAAPPS